MRFIRSAVARIKSKISFFVSSSNGLALIIPAMAPNTSLRALHVPFGIHLPRVINALTAENPPRGSRASKWQAQYIL
jgi:hypothetical protein